ncbi:MAG TPA: class I SAM-dependent methyltransferase [Streptosporangiaceae bacterium]
METAPDGSPVELYVRLRPAGEPELITGVLSPGASVLELGCGTGRIADALVALDHPTTGVDQSAAMLAHVHRAEPVLADIEDLDLGRRFDAVVLGSRLVNVADPARRQARLATCARHLGPGGVVLVERHDPAWAAQVADGPLGEQDGMSFALERVTRHGDRLSAASVYVIGGRELRHRWTAQILDDAALDRELATVGLARRRFLDLEATWVLCTSA